MRSKILFLAVAGGLLSPLAAGAQEAPKFTFEHDVVRGAGPGAKGPGCVLNGQFKHGETIIFRVRVRDAKTGASLDDKALKNLQIELASGEKVPMSYHAHPPRGAATDYFWSGGWIVPDKEPTGSFTYKVIATDKEGHDTSWKPFNVVASQLTVLAD